MKAVQETDNRLVASRITDARLIIADRVSGLEPIGEYERAEIIRALHELAVLERERVPKHLL